MGFSEISLFLWGLWGIFRHLLVIIANSIPFEGKKFPPDGGTIRRKRLPFIVNYYIFISFYHSFRNIYSLQSNAPRAYSSKLKRISVRKSSQFVPVVSLIADKKSISVTIAPPANRAT